MLLFRTLPLALAFAAYGCTLAPPPQRLPLQHDVITAREVAVENASSAYDLVERLRPYFLRGRNAFLDAAPLVYLDDVLLGDVETLRTISAHDVVEIRYRRGEEMLFRSSEASGRRVIQVVTRRD